MLDLTGNDIDEHGVDLLCRALRSNRTLTELRLGGNALRHDGGMAVAQLLQENDTLTHLGLANCMLDVTVAPNKWNKHVFDMTWNHSMRH